jgi:hypothetical protein
VVKVLERHTTKLIQVWIERIENHVKEVIRLKGGNEYREGRCKGKEKKTICY